MTEKLVDFVEATTGQSLTPWQRRWLPLLESPGLVTVRFSGRGGWSGRDLDYAQVLVRLVQRHMAVSAEAKRMRLRRMHTMYSRRHT